MNVVITGGCGLIGSHLAERLLERGDSVMVLEDLSTDVTKLERTTGFRPGTPLSEIIRDVVEDQRTRMQEQGRPRPASAAR